MPVLVWNATAGSAHLLQLGGGCPESARLGCEVRTDGPAPPNPAGSHVTVEFAGIRFAECERFDGNILRAIAGAQLRRGRGTAGGSDERGGTADRSSCEGRRVQLARNVAHLRLPNIKDVMSNDLRVVDLAQERPQTVFRLVPAARAWRSVSAGPVVPARETESRIRWLTDWPVGDGDDGPYVTGPSHRPSQQCGKRCSRQPGAGSSKLPRASSSGTGLLQRLVYEEHQTAI